MLDDIYILLDYVNIVNDKLLNTVASCVIRRIVTYHYTVPTVVWMVGVKETVTNLWLTTQVVSHSLARVGRARSLYKYQYLLVV